MRKWKGISARIVRYLEADLEPEIIRRAEDHLARCGKCAARLEELRRVVRALQGYPSPEFKEALRERIRLEVFSDRAKGDVGESPAPRPGGDARRKAAPVRRPRLLAIAASLAIGVVGVLYFAPSLDRPSLVSFVDQQGGTVASGPLVINTDVLPSELSDIVNSVAEQNCGLAVQVDVQPSTGAVVLSGEGDALIAFVRQVMVRLGRKPNELSGLDLGVRNVELRPGR